MSFSFPDLLTLARFTLQSPREGAALVMRADVPMPARWVALVLMAVMSSVLAHLSFGMMPPEAQAQMGTAMSSPFRTALFQLALMLASVHAVYWVGRWRGGTGSFADALILMVWLQFILLMLQVLQIMVQLVLPPAADLIGLLSVGIFLWLLSSFIAELHKFSSVGKTFLGVIGFMLALGVVMAFVLFPIVGGGL